MCDLGAWQQEQGPEHTFRQALNSACLARKHASQAGRAAFGWATLSNGATNALSGGLRTGPAYLWGRLTRAQLAA